MIADGVHLTVSRERRRLVPQPGVRIHTTTHPLAEADVISRHGVRLTAPARTIADVTAAGMAPDQVSAAVSQALRRGLTTPALLREAARSRGHRVQRLVEAALAGVRLMRYASAGAFRRALEMRLATHARDTGRSMVRKRKEVAFDRLLARLFVVAPERWVLKGALALDYRFSDRARTTKDIDLATAGDEASATADVLAAQALDVGDFFNFAIERTSARDRLAEGAAVRYHVRAELAGRVFDEFLLDVGFDPPTGIELDRLRGPDLLAFAEIAPVEVPAIPIEFHMAEKLHAYSRVYGVGSVGSTRVKDLIDLALIASEARLDARKLRTALETTFGRRASHGLPARLPRPPTDWRVPYGRMGRTVGLDADLDVGFDLAARLLDPVLGGAVQRGVWDPVSQTWT